MTTSTHEIDYNIIGDDMQAVVVTLDPEETVVAEAGNMMYMEGGIEMATALSMTGKDGGIFGKLFKAGKRVLSGDSFFVTHYGNTSSERCEIAFASPYPGQIVPIDLSEHDGTVTLQKDAFLCGAHGVDLDIAFQKRLGVGFFGGEGFILQKLSSEDGQGMCFAHACGTVIRRELIDGEKLRLDTGCVVGFEQSVEFKIEWVKGVKNKLFGGEGLFWATLTGPGTIWMQTLPFSRLADRIYAAAPQLGGKSKGESSVLGGVFRAVGGK
jgi:uncharacterized protein (TIGR00266 family)